MPPTDRHTVLLGYIQCHYIQILPEHSSPRCELFSSPVLRRKELLGQNRALSKSGGSSEHKAGSKQAQQLRSLHLFQCLAGTRESWWQSQQPGPVQWDPSKDTQQQHRFNPLRLLQQQLPAVVRRKVCHRTKLYLSYLHSQLRNEILDVSAQIQRKMHPTSLVLKHSQGLDHKVLQPSLPKLVRAGPG